MDKKTSLKINNRTETVFGISSLILGVSSTILFCITVYMAAYWRIGNEILIGVIELIAMLFCLVGVVFGLIGETRLDQYKRTAHFGIAINVLIGIMHVLVLINGY